MTLEGLALLLVFAVLIVIDRPCTGCGRFFWHRLDCRHRPL